MDWGRKWIGALTLSLLLKLTPIKLEPWFFLWSFFFLYKSIMLQCMKHCCHVWTGAPSWYLELLDKLQRRICKRVDPSLAATLEPLAHCRNVASLNLFYRYYFGRYSSELAQLVPLPYSWRKSLSLSPSLSLSLCVCVCVCVYTLPPVGFFQLHNVFDIREKFGSTIFCCEYSVTFCQVPSSLFPSLSYFTSKDENFSQPLTGEKTIWYNVLSVEKMVYIV